MARPQCDTLLVSVAPCFDTNCVICRLEIFKIYFFGKKNVFVKENREYSSNNSGLSYFSTWKHQN